MRYSFILSAFLVGLSLLGGILASDDSKEEKKASKDDMPKQSVNHYRILAANEDPDSNVVMQVVDGGRRLSLGQLYDARKDISIPTLLWSQELIDEYKEEIPASQTTSTTITTDSTSNRASLLGLDLSVTAMTLANPRFDVEFSGSFNYLKEKKYTSRSVRVANNINTRTVKYNLNAFDHDLLNPTNMNQWAFQNIAGCQESAEGSCKPATHFVSSITYGANVITSIESIYSSTSEKEKVEIALSGKLSVPLANGASNSTAEEEIEADGAQTNSINGEVSGGVTSDSESDDVLANTKISVYGDVKLTGQIPTNVDDAVEFMKNLPEQLIDDIGVPMEITLTPLSWVHGNAAKLLNKVKGDVLKRIIEVYDSLETSDVLIRDTLSTPSGGYKAWRRNLQTYYNSFRGYRSDLSLLIGRVLTGYGSGQIELRDVASLERDYWDSENYFNVIQIMARLTEEEDIIGNLMALSTEFQQAGIVFGDRLSSFTAPTFKTNINRVYGLVIAGMYPASDRDGIKKIRNFINLARSRHLKDEGDKDFSHCDYSLDADGNIECKETQAFVAIHFDSYCNELCPTSFCAKQQGEEDLPLCPTVPVSDNDVPFCNMHSDDAEILQCSINNYQGECYPLDHDDRNNEHVITNDLNPFSDCWCACPTTQIIEYVEGSIVRRVHEDFPKTPDYGALEIVSVTSHTSDTDDVEASSPMAQVVYVNVNVNEEVHYAEKARNFAVEVHNLDVEKTASGVDYITDTTTVFTDSLYPKIQLENLVAGETYRIKVAAMNEVGIGPFVEYEPITVGYRMPVQTNICVLPKIQTCSQPSIYANATIPAYLNTRIAWTLSTPTSSAIHRITMHYEMGHDVEVDVAQLDDVVATSPILVECTFLAEESFRRGIPGTNETVQCTFEMQKLWENEESQLRLVSSTIGQSQMTAYVAVWDGSDILIAKGQWTLLLPSEDNCKSYGSFPFYCDYGVGNRNCVSDCKAFCGGTNADGNYCKTGSCSTGVYCPVPYEFRPDLYKERVSETETRRCLGENLPTNELRDSLCRSDCYETSRLYQLESWSNPRIADFPFAKICLSPCYLTLDEANVERKIVERGETEIVGCKEGYFSESEGSVFFFTCPGDESLGLIASSFTPSFGPTVPPSDVPSIVPSDQPSNVPSMSSLPSLSPTEVVSGVPSESPSFTPSVAPSSSPTMLASDSPTIQATTQSPTDVPDPTEQPTSNEETEEPTGEPTIEPTLDPTSDPSAEPTKVPIVSLTAPPFVSGQYLTEPCIDDSTFRKNGKEKKDCNWVGSSDEEKRVKLCTENMDILDACPLSCGVCCHDEASFTFVTVIGNRVRERNCAWIEENNKQKRCDETYNGVLVSDMCPKACNMCRASVFPTETPSSTPIITSDRRNLHSSHSDTRIKKSSNNVVSTSTEDDKTMEGSHPNNFAHRMSSLKEDISSRIQGISKSKSIPGPSKNSMESDFHIEETSSHLPSKIPSLKPSSSETTVLPSLDPSATITTTQPTSLIKKVNAGLLNGIESMKSKKASVTNENRQDPSSEPTSLMMKVKAGFLNNFERTSRKASITEPSAEPTSEPTSEPTKSPTTDPTQDLSDEPSSAPSLKPSVQPSHIPSAIPSTTPSLKPSDEPSSAPSLKPSVQPSDIPSINPSDAPSLKPSQSPSDEPTVLPSALPSLKPSAHPSDAPSMTPSQSPSDEPSAQPSNNPSSLLSLYDDGTSWYYDPEKVVRLERAFFSNFTEADLKCVPCPEEGQKFNRDLKRCLFERHTNGKSLNYVIGGNFDNTETWNKYFTSNAQASLVDTEDHADLVGGSVKLTFQGEISQVIKLQTEALDPPDININPPADSVWGASVYFKVPPSLQNSDTSQSVGQLILGTTPADLYLDRGSSDEWIRTDVRYRAKETDSTLTVRVTSTLENDLFIDVLEVVPLEGIIEAQMSEYDLVSSFVKELNRIDSNANSGRRAFEDVERRYENLNQAYQDDKDRLEEEDRQTDLVLQRLGSFDSKLLKFIRWNTNFINDALRILNGLR